jgi:hypothetical protein
MIKTIIFSTFEFISNAYFISTILVLLNIYQQVATNITLIICYKNDFIFILLNLSTSHNSNKTTDHSCEMPSMTMASIYANISSIA